MTVGSFHLDGSYLSFSDIREENVDQLRLMFTVRSFILRAWERACLS
jgi:hypothetical protein